MSLLLNARLSTQLEDMLQLMKCWRVSEENVNLGDLSETNLINMEWRFMLWSMQKDILHMKYGSLCRKTTPDNDTKSVGKRTIQPTDKTGRIANNYFNSTQFANDLYANHRLTVVGTIRKNKPPHPSTIIGYKGQKSTI